MKKLTLLALVLALFCGSASAGRYVFEDEKSDNDIVITIDSVYELYLKYRYIDYDGVYGDADSFWWFIEQKTWREEGCDEEEMAVYFEELLEKGKVVLRDTEEACADSESIRQEKARVMKLYESTRSDFVYIDGTYLDMGTDEFWEDLRSLAEEYDFDIFSDIRHDRISNYNLIHKANVFKSDALTLALSRWECYRDKAVHGDWDYTSSTDWNYWDALRKIEDEYGSDYALQLFVQDFANDCFTER